MTKGKQAFGAKTTKPKLTQARRVSKLTEVWIAKNRERLTTIILRTTDQMDDFIEKTTRGHQPVSIWSTMERDDAEIIADILLEGGRKSVYVAQIVENIISYYDKMRALGILGPRSYLTIMTYIERGIGLR